MNINSSIPTQDKDKDKVKGNSIPATKLLKLNEVNVEKLSNQISNLPSTSARSNKIAFTAREYGNKLIPYSEFMKIKLKTTDANKTTTSSFYISNHHNSQLKFRSNNLKELIGNPQLSNIYQNFIRINTLQKRKNVNANDKSIERTLSIEKLNLSEKLKVQESRVKSANGVFITKSNQVKKNRNENSEKKTVFIMSPGRAINTAPNNTNNTNDNDYTIKDDFRTKLKKSSIKGERRNSRELMETDIPNQPNKLSAKTRLKMILLSEAKEKLRERRTPPPKFILIGKDVKKNLLQRQKEMNYTQNQFTTTGYTSTVPLKRSKHTEQSRESFENSKLNNKIGDQILKFDSIKLPHENYERGNRVSLTTKITTPDKINTYQRPKTKNPQKSTKNLFNNEFILRSDREELTDLPFKHKLQRVKKVFMQEMKKTENKVKKILNELRTVQINSDESKKNIASTLRYAKLDKEKLKEKEKDWLKEFMEKASRKHSEEFFI